MMMFEA